MTQPWTFAGDPPLDRRSGGATVTLLDGTTFTISEESGDITPGGTQGLFVRDTRMLSRWELGVSGEPFAGLTVQRTTPHSAAFLARVPPPPGRADSPVVAIRRRFVGNGQREDLTLRNSSPQPFVGLVTLTIESDFADLFEVKDGRSVGTSMNARHTASSEDGSVFRLGRERGNRSFSISVSADRGAEATDLGLQWHVVVPAHGEWTTSIEAVPEFDGQSLVLRHPRGEQMDSAAPVRDLESWRDRAPHVQTPNRDLAEALRRSHEDLGTLRVFHPDEPERAVVAAGAPWFMALFGRDSLLTSWMLLPFDTNMALGTLRTLADHQGRSIDPDSEEEPGKILHEMRFGPAVKLNLGGRNVYYGTVDATPLFVMLLGELHRWRGRDAEIYALVPAADRALAWVENYGDADGDGFVEYERKTEQGLVNQGWKDSWDGVTFADGSIAEAPIALAEVQAYVYAAYLARARLAESMGEHNVARVNRDKAAALKLRFNEQFWLPDKGWFAVGLDRDKRPIDSLTSNIGHCLWTGIIDDDKAASVAHHLVSPEMFSGWGIRTLASSMGAYNPLSYHNGSVWPHDNALCVAGLMRYGFVAEAQLVADSVLGAGRYFGHRLPELFAGFGRDDFAAPVPYPTACSPQAWAAAAPLELLRSMLRFESDLSTRTLACAPAVPAHYLPLRVANLRLADDELLIEVTASGWDLSGSATTTLELVPPGHAAVSSR